MPEEKVDEILRAIIENFLLSGIFTIEKYFNPDKFEQVFFSKQMDISTLQMYLLMSSNFN